MRPSDVILTIRGVNYVLQPMPAMETPPGRFSAPVQALVAALGDAETSLRPRPDTVGTGYVYACVEAVHAYRCAYVRLRKGKYGPCDCGAHEAMDALLARGRV